MGSKYFFSMDAQKPLAQSSGGTLSRVSSKEAAGLVNISFAQLHLKKRGTIGPLWHSNANKIGYCTEGQFLVTMRTPTSVETFTVKKGELFFAPKGYVHHLENISDQDRIIHFALDNDLPENAYLTNAVYSLSDSVFNSTFNSKTGFVDGLKKNKSEIIRTLPPLKEAPKGNNSDYKYAIGDGDKVVLTKGGYVQLGTKVAFPVLNGLGILGFGLNPKGAVEPHIHTNAGELIYIVKGKTRITLAAPDGTIESLEVNGGQGAFAPASHFHNIENVGSDEVEVIAFFSNEDPDFIGVGEIVGAYSNEVLASVFNTTPEYFADLKKPQKPEIIVPL